VLTGEHRGLSSSLFLIGAIAVKLRVTGETKIGFSNREMVGW
jgi:hypothetical protein